MPCNTFAPSVSLTDGTLIAIQGKRIEELGDTMAALAEKMELVNQLNWELEGKLQSEEGRRKELAVANEILAIRIQLLENAIKARDACLGELSLENESLRQQAKTRGEEPAPRINQGEGMLIRYKEMTEE